MFHSSYVNLPTVLALAEDNVGKHLKCYRRYVLAYAHAHAA